MEKTSQEWIKIKQDFKDWYEENIKVLTIVKDMYQSLITSLLFDQNDFSNPQIEARIKDKKECISKFERKYLNDIKSEDLTDSTSIVKAKLTDLIGLRVICSYDDEIYKIKNIFKENFNILSETDKSEKLTQNNKFGYKGLHLDVKLKSDRANLKEYEKIKDFQVEIQIRTIIQHAWSSLEHKILYKKENIPELNRAAERLAALFEIADSEFIRLRDKTEELKSESEKIIESKEKTEKQTINSITFYQFLRKKFDKYNFLEKRSTDFLEEIQKCNPDFNLPNLSKAYEKNFNIVEDFKEKNKKILSMNPYTMLRHILYASDKDLYLNLLTSLQRDKFEEFLKNHKES